MDAIIRILYLEDDPADAELIQARLGEADLACRITRVQTKDEFEQGLRQDPLDIILADYRLPVYDGMSALRLTLDRCPEIPFIFVSGTMGEEAAIAALTQGATDYVLKNNLSRLPPAIKRALKEASNKRERRQAQEALQHSNEMLRAIIEAAPVAIIGLDLEGRVHSVWNPAAEKMLGWHAQDAMGRTLPTVSEANREEFERLEERIHKGMTLDGVEVHRQRRDGTPIDYSIYASPLHDVQGRISGNIAVLVDITERRRNSMINAARLHLMQFAVNHSMDELLEETINEAEKVTDSLIGFYHTVDDDQQSLTLQNWSTRTKTRFCTARGKGSHYPIAAAGVWADCVRLRKPVVHNDYMAQPDRKELPDGHAEIVRELVVPVVRGDIIKAILGVGNKPVDYSEKDVAAMSLLADLVWEITERKQAEERVALMSFALDSVQEAAFLIDESARLQYVNEAACRLLGYARDDLLAMTVSDIHPGFPMERWPDHWRDLKEHGALTFEGELKTKDDSLFWVEINANYFEYGGRSYDLGLVRDIGERKQLETRRSEQLYFLQQLIDSIPLPVYYKDREGLYLGCNAAFEAFISLPRKDIVGKTVHDITSKERADKHHDADLALLRQGGVQTYEVSGVYQDGKLHDVIFNKAMFVDAYDRVAGTVGTLIDITDRKQAERERLASLHFFESMDRVNRAIQGAGDLDQMMRSVLDAIIGVFDCDKTQLVFPCNPAADTWAVKMERTKPGYRGLAQIGDMIPMTPEVAAIHRISRQMDRPVRFGAGTDLPLTEKQREAGEQSGMGMAIYPKNADAWGFSMEQCSHPRIWTPEEMRLFEAIGRRLADSLTSLLSLRDLRKNEEFLDKVVEHIPNMIFVKDAKSLRFVRLNKAGERLVGYPREELLDRTVHGYFPKEMVDYFTAQDRQVLDSKNLLDIPEETIRNRRNEERVLHTKKIPILDETGTPQFLLGISEDITQRKQAEESIRKLSQAIEQSPVSIVITDANGTIEFVNARFTECTGYAFAEALGQNPSILKSGETPIEEYKRLWETIRSGGVWRGEFHNRKKNGELFWEQATIAPVRNADNITTHYVAVKEDITERKKLERQLRQAQKMEAVGQLAGGVAHDFNNMLGVIIGHTELALEGMDSAQPLFASLGQIHKAALHSADLTRQLLAFARKQTIAPKVLDLNDTVEGMLKMMRRLIGEEIDLAWLPGSKVWPVKMDPSQIDQILANLCVNARDAIDGVGRITIETRNSGFDDNYCADHPGFIPGEYVLLAVSDNGGGMDSEILGKIFEPFFTTKEVGKGTGLGLATVYGIVKQNDGFVNVYSEPGHGTTFKIYLPRHGAVSDAALTEIPSAESMRGDETVLVVEDEASILGIVKEILESYGYRVLAASTPGEAINMAKAQTDRIHLLLTDIVMPEMNGRELARQMGAFDPQVKCLFMSGYTANTIIHHGVLGEDVHFIQKPFSKHTLAAKVREVLDAK